MKTLFFATVAVAQLAALDLTMPFQLQPVVAGDNEGTVNIDVSDIARLQVRLLSDGETGIGRLLTTTGANRYELDGSNIVLHVANSDQSILQYKLTVSGVYGQVKLNATIVLNVTKDGQSSIVLDPYVFDAIQVAGGSAGMEQYILTLNGGKFHHGDEELTFEQVKEVVLDTSKFVYLKFANAFHLPCFVVDAEGRQSVEFTSSFVIGGEAHIERVIINEQEQIDVDNVQLLRINEDGGVAFGYYCEATENYAFAHGYIAKANKEYSHAEGSETNANGKFSHAEGYQTTTSNLCAHAEGSGTTASGDCAHAEGSYTIASGYYSHAEGDNSSASGYCSHAEGELTTASGDKSHAEGQETTASGYCSHAEGEGTEANGERSHAEGLSTTAESDYAHAEGDETDAEGFASHAEGLGTKTLYDNQHAQGTFNNAADFDGEDGAFMHGCGTGENNRKNAFAIAADGKVYVIGLGGYDGTNHTEALSLQEIFGASIIQAATNKRVNNYDVPNLTPEQVTQAYNAVVAGKSVTITDATGNYHLGVTQADVLNGDIAISLIYLNVMLLTYEISGSAVDVQFKNL